MDLVQRPISLQAVFDEILVQNRILAENKGLALELMENRKQIHRIMSITHH